MHRAPTSVYSRAMRLRALLTPLAFAPVLACDPTPAPPDASALVDTGAADDAPADAAVSPPDAGTDAPFYRPDGGPTGMALTPLDACDDLVASLYATPPDLPPFEASLRGTLLGCAAVETISAVDLATRLGGVPGLERTGGDVRVYVIAYRTEREPRGVGGISTALVYLPDVARSARVPTVLALHGTVGVADVCAPSRFVREGLDAVGLPAPYLDALFLSFAAAGLPVIAPDYAGLGTDGVHGYGNWLDPARSSIDGARALRALLPADRLDGGTLVYGHSQGGGIALAVAALADEDPTLDLRAIVATAPGYDVASATTIVRLPGFALDPVLRTTGALYAYADYANLTDEEARWGEPFAAGVRDTVVRELSSHCFVEAGTNLDMPSAGYVPPTTVGELFDPAFVEAVTACLDDAACTGLTGAWVARDTANEPDIDADAPPILVMSSTEDEVATPGSIGCVTNRLRDDMAPFEFCAAAAGDHLAMVPRTMGHAIDWAIARASGEPAPVCPGTRTPPRCSLF